MTTKGQRIIQTRAGKVHADAHLSFALNQKLKDQIKEVAKQRKVSTSELLRRAAEHYIECQT